MAERVENIERELARDVSKLQNIEERLRKVGDNITSSFNGPLIYPSVAILDRRDAGEIAIKVVLLPLTITIGIIALPFVAIASIFRARKLRRRREKYQNKLRDKVAEMIAAFILLEISDKKIEMAIENLHFTFLEKNFCYLKIREIRYRHISYR